MAFSIRTDLADESHSLWQQKGGDAGKLRGVRASQSLLRGLPLTEVEILNEEDAAALGKASGHYYTLELPSFLPRGDERFSDGAAAIAELLCRCLPKERSCGVLLAASIWRCTRD